MPDTFVVHLGNSKELMEVAENSVAKRVLREHVRANLGVQNEDLLFAIINSMLLLTRRSSCEKGWGGKVVFPEMMVHNVSPCEYIKNQYEGGWVGERKFKDELES